MNERTHFFIKNTSHSLYERVDVGCVWEVSWRRVQTATYWPKALLTIAALLSHFGWVTRPWVTEGPKFSVYQLFSRWHLVPNWLQLQLELTQAVCCTLLYYCLRPTASCGRTHLPPSPNSTTFTGQGDIPISSTGCTWFAVLMLIYTGASLDWRLGRGSVCYVSDFLYCFTKSK